MSHKYPLIAAAVVAAIGSSYAGAAIPTLAQAKAPTVQLVIAGSSAASSAIGTAVQTTLCGGAANTLSVTSSGGSANFLAFSCFTATPITGNPGIPTNTLVTIYYRTEGGSVVGALPIATGHNILRLDLASGSCTQPGNTGAVTCSITGATTVAGIADTWAGAVTSDTVQLGVTDVEPAQLTNLDYPSNYSPAAFGTATPAQLANLTTAKLFDQVFGLVVNTQGQSFTSVNLTKESAANILSLNYTDWSVVPDAITGAPIASAPSAITRVDREPGSGTRTSTNIFFFDYQCGSQTAIKNQTGEVLNFTTGDELNFANSHPGAIAYASIDQIQNPANQTKWTNLKLATINGVTPSNRAAATGAYDFWYEATLVPNAAVGQNTTAGNLITFLEANLPRVATAPSVPDILVIPNVGNPRNVGATPLNDNGKTGTAQVFVNPYTRGASSCNVPSETNS